MKDEVRVTEWCVKGPGQRGRPGQGTQLRWLVEFMDSLGHSSTGGLGRPARTQTQC